MQGDESSGEESLMFFLQGECEAVDDGSEDLKQFRNTIVSLSVVDELEEYVGNGSTDEST